MIKELRKEGIQLFEFEEDKKPRILMTRIDNRLVHGQVGVTWTKTLNANLIIVADDETANNILQQKLMGAVARASGAEIRFFSLQHTMNIISQASPYQKIFIVLRSPKDAMMLLQGGVPIEKLNIGNMHFKHGKEMLTKKVYVDEEDITCFKKMLQLGVKLFIQDVPGSSIEHVNEKMLEKIK